MWIPRHVVDVLLLIFSYTIIVWFRNLVTAKRWSIFTVHYFNTVPFIEGSYKIRMMIHAISLERPDLCQVLPNCIIFRLFCCYLHFSGKMAWILCNWGERGIGQAFSMITCILALIFMLSNFQLPTVKGSTGQVVKPSRSLFQLSRAGTTNPRILSLASQRKNYGICDYSTLAEDMSRWQWVLYNKKARRKVIFFSIAAF